MNRYTAQHYGIAWKTFWSTIIFKSAELQTET